jgi:hypothetical protein
MNAALEQRGTREPLLLTLLKAKDQIITRAY